MEDKTKQDTGWGIEKVPAGTTEVEAAADAAVRVVGVVDLIDGISGQPETIHPIMLAIRSPDELENAKQAAASTGVELRVLGAGSPKKAAELYAAEANRLNAAEANGLYAAEANGLIERFPGSWGDTAREYTENGGGIISLMPPDGQDLTGFWAECRKLNDK